MLLCNLFKLCVFKIFMKNIYTFFILLLFVTGCVDKANFAVIPSQNEIEHSFNKEAINSWHFKDIVLDTIPGTSLEKTYDSILKNKKGKEIIVAVIDMPIDIKHKNLKDNIWINKDEIPNNDIDDDDNGYIDDINGWNFIGNSNGKINRFVNYEVTRILKNSNIEAKDYAPLAYLKNRYEERYTKALEDTSYINMVSNSKTENENIILKYLGNKALNSKNIDSLKKAHPNDTILQTAITVTNNFIKYGFTEDYISDYKIKAEERISKLLSLNYDERKIIGDDSEKIEDKDYGNNNVSQDSKFLSHGTPISGLIIAKSINEEDSIEIVDHIKIMPLCISSYGNEHDKDIALAIRYAVNNGAKVINMSIGKEFSLHKNWVFDAFKYAEQHDVLIVSGAGNSKYDLNIYNHYYPNDNINNEREVSDNFIKIGATTYHVNEKLFWKYSNYGNIDVDVFAPGYRIYSTVPTEKKYKLQSGGTSLSCAITSNIAALIRSYYPNLSASQVKHILMDSGVEYTFNVKIGDTLLPFKTLSKSGKVVNAYNALIMADSVSPKK